MSAEFGPPAGTLTCHASCVVLDEAGVLVRGASGAGKTSLCLALLDRCAAAGRYARLVGDDCIVLRAAHGRLVARAHPRLGARIEVRGLGVLRARETAPACVLRLVVDLVASVPRMPARPLGSTRLHGVRLPVLRLEPGQAREYFVDTTLAALQRRRTGRESVS